MSSRLSYPFNLEDLPDVGTENEVAGTFVSLYPAVSTYKFHILFFFFFFSVWPPSLRKDEDPEKSTRHFSDLSLTWSLGIQQSHVLQGHSFLSQPTTSSLFSQQGIAFPVLALVWAYITSFSPPPAASCFAWVLGSLYS